MDALASEGDEGRGKLRKVSGNRKQVLIRESPNGATQPVEDWLSAPEYIGCTKSTQGSETSQYLVEKKENSIP